jgi:predicted DNA-binding protein
MVAISVRVPRDTAARLRAIADANYRPVAAQVRLLIEEHLADREPA